MDAPELKLVTRPPDRRGTPLAVVLGAAVLAAAALATAFGADASRGAFDPARLAQAALAATLTADDPGPVKHALAVLNARLRKAPLDAASRTVAASLMAETASDGASREAAAAQARAATRLVRSDEWIAAGAARVLARCGRADLALGEIARMFDYAPDDAALTLMDVAPWVPDDRVEDAIPATPKAWLAWSTRLREAGRDSEADARLAALLARWPGDLRALCFAASAAAGNDRIEELRRLVPPSLALPETLEAAPLFAFRARSRAASGDAASARADALHAVTLSRGEPWVLAMAGDAVAGTEPALARDLWTRGLYRVLQSAATKDASIWFRVRLARLDEREGRAGDALREWRAVLAVRPDDPEATRRIADLTGERGH